MANKEIVSQGYSWNPDASRSTTFYACNDLNIQDLLDYCSSDTIGSIFQNLSNDPQSFITSIRVYPFDFSTLTGGSVVQDSTLKVGRWACDFTADGMASSYCYRLTRGFKNRFNLGTYTFTPHFNNFLDYSPYTKYELYLPYCGFADMSSTEYMGKTISIDYIVDYSTGGCIAVVTDITNSSDKVVLFTKKGLMGIPITWQATNSAQIMRGLMQTAVSTVSSVTAGAITGGAAKANWNKGYKAEYAAQEAEFKKTFQEDGMDWNKETLRDRKLMVGETMQPWLESHPKPNGLFGGNQYLTAGIIQSAANGLTNTGFNTPFGIDRGEIGGDFSIFCMPQTPYIIITRTHTALPSNYQTMMGKPSGRTATLSDLSGYTEVDAIRVEGITSSNGVSPTTEELTTIASALHSGVIL